METNNTEIKDISAQGVLSFIKERYPKWSIFLVIVNVFFIYVIWSSKFPPIIMFVFIFDLIFLAIFSAIKKKAFMKQFAEINGYSYADRGDIGQIKALFLKIGHTRNITHVISGEYKNCPMRLFEFNAVIGHGKHRRYINFTTFEITYKTKLRSIFLRSKKNKWGITNFFESIGDDMAFGKVLKLEGDFNDYFTLYVPNEDYEMEALQIFTPEIMVKLMDTANGFSFEFIDDKLYIYNKNIIYKKAGLDNLYAFSKTLIEDLAPRLERIK